MRFLKSKSSVRPGLCVAFASSVVSHIPAFLAWDRGARTAAIHAQVVSAPLTNHGA